LTVKYRDQLTGSNLQIPVLVPVTVLCFSFITDLESETHSNSDNEESDASESDKSRNSDSEPDLANNSDSEPDNLGVEGIGDLVDSIVETDYLGADSGSDESEEGSASEDEESSDGGHRPREKQVEVACPKKKPATVAKGRKETWVLPGQSGSGDGTSNRKTGTGTGTSREASKKRGSAEAKKQPVPPGKKQQAGDDGPFSWGDEEFLPGQFVTAFYQGEWLLAVVEENQSDAGPDHLYLSYMERVGKNQFKWPHPPDVLLTWKDDILSKCPPPTSVGSLTRANHVSMAPSDMAFAEFAMDEVVNLQSFSQINLPEKSHWGSGLTSFPKACTGTGTGTSSGALWSIFWEVYLWIS